MLQKPAIYILCQCFLRWTFCHSAHRWFQRPWLLVELSSTKWFCISAVSIFSMAYLYPPAFSASAVIIFLQWACAPYSTCNAGLDWIQSAESLFWTYSCSIRVALPEGTLGKEQSSAWNDIKSHASILHDHQAECYINSSAVSLDKISFPWVTAN